MVYTKGVYFMKTAALGKGLQSLFSIQNDAPLKNYETEEMYDTDKVYIIATNQLISNENRLRKNFNKEKMEELKQSILKHGLLVPILVKQNGDNYQIISGERRYRAIKELNLDTVLVRILNLGQEETIEVALTDNMQREDLNYIEIAEALTILVQKYKLTHETIAEALSIHRSSVSNLIRLMELPEKVKDKIRDNELSPTSARILLKIQNEEEQIIAMNEYIKNNWTIADLDNYIKTCKQYANNLDNKDSGDNKVKEKKTLSKNKFYQDIETHLGNKFKTKVTLKQLKDRCKIEIEYYDDEDLKRILGAIQ